MKKVIWTPVAKESLEQTEEFLSELWSDQVFEEFLDKLDYRIEQIKQNPELAPTFQQSEFRRLLIHKTVSLFYKNQPKFIKLLLVWDNRVKPTELLSKLTDANIRQKSIG